MTPCRVSAVSYINARPLVHGLDGHEDLFTLRFEVPAKCAALLHERSVDLSLIPSIEYLHRNEYRIVPDLAVASVGPVGSVALFSERPTAAVRSIAVDASSRTAVALLRILCAQWFDIEPKFVTMQPELPAMLKRCDAALLIGDTALFTEHETKGLDKVDLGEEWAAMTGLPFVWSFWAGRPDAVDARQIAVLREARDAGVQALDEIAQQFAPAGEGDEPLEITRAYLHDNVFYTLDEDGLAGLKKFFDAASDLGLVPTTETLRFY